MKINKSSAAEKWLEDFLSVRGLGASTGQHLFTYHATSEEYDSLQMMLCQLVKDRKGMKEGDSFRWQGADADHAAFVLYTSLFWQKHYEGSRLTWGDIWKSLGVFRTENMNRDSAFAVRQGLRWWKLDPNSNGHIYIGTTFREAGFPQNLLAKGHGKIGDILGRVLKKALGYEDARPYIEGWTKDLVADLPASYKGQGVIVSLLSETVKTILELKSVLKAQTAAEALLELDQNIPNWRRNFCFPLDGGNSRKLLERLLGEAVASSVMAAGRPMRAVRKLVCCEDGRWKLCASVEFPKNIHLDSTRLEERRVGIHVTAGQSERGPLILRRRAEGEGGVSLYFVQNRQEWSFEGADAAGEIVLRCSSVSGVLGREDCVGGTELDGELPWVFESKEYGFAFCQQGGGCVRGKEACVALRPGWIAEGAELLGVLEGVGRELWKLSSPSSLSGEGEVFHVRLGGAAPGETLDWRLDQKGMPEMVWPKLVSKGMPQVVLRTEDGEMRCSGEIRWKASGESSYVPFGSRLASGPASVSFQSEGGASLRSSMLLIKESARYAVKADKDEGKLVFDGWGFSSAALAAGQPEVVISCKVESGTGRFSIGLSLEKGAMPPEYVDLLLHWEGCGRDVHIRAPFPQKGIRMFDSGGARVDSGSRLCVSSLQGMRLHFFGLDPKAVRFSLSLSHDRRKRLDYPLRTENRYGEIWMLDWQKRLTEMLALDSGLDSLVELECLVDGDRIGYWKFSRYAEEFERGEGAVSLHRKRDGLCRRDVRAILLTRPGLEPVSLSEISDPDLERQSWGVEPLKMTGPWLIYDASAETSTRPLLHEVKGGEDVGEQDRLQQAIGRSRAEERSKAFRKCIRTMLEDAMAPEWNTLFRLLERLRHLPLSSLEVWKELIRQPRIMAVLALHDELDFVGITSRAISELPFLWNFVSRADWAFASRFVRERCVRRYGQYGLADGDIDRIWRGNMEDRLDLLKSYSPSVYTLAGIAMELPGESWEKKRSEAAMFSIDALRMLLFEGEYCSLQKLLRRHLEDPDWPEEFSGEVCDASRYALLSGYLPRCSQEGGLYDWQYSVAGLPMLFMLQCFTSGLLPVELRLCPDTVYAVRKHIRFDPAWFEEVSNLTASCCYGQNFHYPCEVE